MLEFHQKGLDAAEASYRSLRMNRAQDALLKDLAKLVGPRIGMDRIPCLGFWLQAVRAWQIEHEAPVDVLQTMSPSERATAAREIRGHFAKIVGAQLRDPSKKAKLESILDEAFQFYLSNYNRR